MWTPTALASEVSSWRGEVWRVAEAQHRISTDRLADTREAQEQLEELAEAVKPPLPESAAGLDYLLASPFRYGHGSASRFRRASERPGIFYASEDEATAIAETAFWRLRFYLRSPGFVPPATTTEHTSFTAKVVTSHALDLTREPFARQEALWTDPADYTACQDLALAARAADIAVIRTLSARDPLRRCNIVLLDPAAFASPKASIRRTWHLRFENGRLSARAALPSQERFVFRPDDFGLA
jgi:RES domain